MTNFVNFLSALFEDGHVFVPEINSISQDEVSSANEYLFTYEKQYRLDLPSGIPQFSIEDAMKSAVGFYRASQFIVNRDASPEMIEEGLRLLKSNHQSPEAHYSVDLVLRYLPDLYSLSRSVMNNDPLVKHLQDWAVQWPLSSVGMKDLEQPVSIEGFFESNGLMRIYCDRIISTEDLTRLDTSEVREMVEASWGMYPELSKTLSTELKQRNNN